MGQREKDGRDGPLNGLETFAAELRAQREAAGLTQDELAKLMGYSTSVIAKLETCRTAPSPQHAAQADAALETPGTFHRLRQGMLNGAYEAWVRALLEMEERAAVLRWWEPLLVPGLLQTEAYADAILRAARPGDADAQIEQLVTARMARQEIWDRQDPPPPMLFAVLGEAVLRQPVGNAKVMREQLDRLIAAADAPRITIQVMPFAAGAHPGLLGPFVVASFDAGPDAAYLDNALDGQVTEQRKQVGRVALLYDTLRSEALSPRGVAGVDREGGAGMDMTGAVWRKSSYSSGNGGACVEVARNLPGVVAVRDSKDPGGPRLAFAPDQWRTFTDQVKAGLFSQA